MKINKDFAVIIGGKRFGAHDIHEIHIDGGSFKMLCDFGNGAEITVECRTRDVEFVSGPQNPILAQGGVATERDGTHTYHEHYKVGDEPASDIEIVSPLKKVKKALGEALKGINGNPETILVDIGLDGNPFVKSLKPGDTWYSRTRDNFDGAGFFDLAMNRNKEDRELREAIKEAVREVMEEDTVELIRMKKDKLKIDNDDFERLMKKYKQNQDRSGGD